MRNMTCTNVPRPCMDDLQTVPSRRLRQACPVASPSAIFEILRFGRCMGDEIPYGARLNHWRKVKTPDGDGWINLSKAGVRVYSDADFPEWAGWSFIGDDPTPDSLCDSPTIKRWLDVNHAGHVSHADAVSALGMDAIRAAHGACRVQVSIRVESRRTGGTV